MTESAFKQVFALFLDKYWGAFHEALEAQSVTPRRLAGSLFDAVENEHRAFEAMYAGPATTEVAELGHVWREHRTRRYTSPDLPLAHDEVEQALRLFREIYGSLVHQGQKYTTARHDIVKHAPHGTPKDPLRADVAR